jgi:hypothetical protein
MFISRLFPTVAGSRSSRRWGAGVPVVLHRHIYSRILSGLELAYPEAFSWRSPADLLAHFATIRVADLPAQSRLARQCYEEFHRPEVLHAYLEHHGGGLADVPPLSEAYEREADEWACWVQGQLGFGRLVGADRLPACKNAAGPLVLGPLTILPWCSGVFRLEYPEPA